MNWGSSGFIPRTGGAIKRTGGSAAAKYSKGLVWENDGFLLLYKRLAQGKYQWPRNEQDVRLLSPQQFRWLMEGLTVTPKKSVKHVKPEYVA